LTADSHPRRLPGCTYRLQFNAGFTFDDAAVIAGYLADLGVTHLYSSPYLQAQAGSTHGYDVVDPTRLNDELGGADGHARLVASLAAHGLGLVLDIVPNHMATDGPANRWWWDVLENGMASRYATYFDIDWGSPRDKEPWKVLVPILGDHYGRVLEHGDLRLDRGDDGTFVVRYFDHVLPLSPATVAGLAAGPDPDAALERINGDTDALDAVLSRQHYRLAYWRTASEELDYRRFFNIQSLVGLRMEAAPVFDDTHALVLRQVAGGVLDGLRVDHVDGLRNPQAYLDRLADRSRGAWVVVEKILERDELLPPWPVAGTTGYDFVNHVNRLFVDPAHEPAFTATWQRFTGDTKSWADVVHEAKRQIMREELVAEVDRLTGRFAEVCDRHRRHRDHTRRELRAALREVLAAFPVYRTYVRPGAPVRETDRHAVHAAVAAAGARRDDVDPELLGFLGEVLLLAHEGPEETELALRFQQVSSPVMAKGVEDTAFYRYHRLVSLNEVGGDPGQFGESPADFHAWCERMAASWPATMLTLSTHDTKRSADVRARINVLSELPAAWADAVARWRDLAHRHRRDGAPDRADEYLLYQTLLGAWPIDAERLARFMEKATKEAKLRTSWIDPDTEYDAAVRDFVTGVCGDADLMADVEGFLTDHDVIGTGRINGLAQVTLLLTCPGVPDLYQGTEVWDLSLVDPDNRRPVDYEARRGLLDQIMEAGHDGALARHVAGGSKLWLIHRLLGHRRQAPDAYGPESGYTPLEVTGPEQDHAVAFCRGDGVAVVVPRLVVGRGGDWDGTTVSLPRGRWRDVLGGGEVEGGRRAIADLLTRFPVAVLARER
jgi:(1->4)-alpha-D-glucan 1-alpha-D-glucosylmutase